MEVARKRVHRNRVEGRWNACREPDGKQAEAGTWAITAVDQVGLYWDDEDPAWNYAVHCDSNGKADKLDWGFEGSGYYARID